MFIKDKSVVQKKIKTVLSLEVAVGLAFAVYLM